MENKTDEPDSVIKAKKYIANHIGEKLSLARIAREVNVSSHYFCKLFKQSTGMTLTEYTYRYRTELAKAELGESSIYFNNLGQAWRLEGDAEKAERSFRKALELNPESGFAKKLLEQLEGGKKPPE